MTIHGRPIPKENPPSKLVGENSRNVARLPSNATLQRSSLLFLHERASERSETTKNQVLSYFLFIVTRTHVYTTKHARVYRSLSCCIFIYIVYLFESSKIPVANVTESYPKADTIANCGGAASMGQIGNDVSLLFVHFSIVFFFSSFLIAVRTIARSRRPGSTTDDECARRLGRRSGCSSSFLLAW